jgi:hypothetical protein
MLVSGPVRAKEAADAIYFQCPLDLTLSARIGVLKKNNGTAIVEYIKGKHLCEVLNISSGTCFVKYEPIMETQDAVVGFHRQSRHPNDTQVSVLDLRNSTFFRTVKQGKIRLSVFANCKSIKKPKL